ncbi:MAG: porin family protein [Rubrivivax sp.]|nr:porin family protein [Rubrivivax sp.]
MKKILFLVTIFLVSVMAASAQDEYPKFELSGTASMLVFDVDILEGETMWGYGIAGQYNVNKYFGIVGEWNAVHGESGPHSFPGNGTIYYVPRLDTRTRTLLFGPRISYRTKPVTVFGHILLGAGTNKLDDDIGEFNYESYTQWQFAMAIGGGIDINLSKRFALRPAQFDYVFMDSDLNSLTGSAQGSSNSFRYQLGAVIKF